ncbi:MAG: hypothetical protein AVDCRST_MAG54-441, partial [uncultured Actinomycetospora sp.]
AAFVGIAGSWPGPRPDLQPSAGPTPPRGADDAATTPTTRVAM